MSDFDPAGVASTKKQSRFERRISALSQKGKYTKSIEETVLASAKNVVTDGIRSFVIYGEPQSGKTEMMIALTARLLDEGNKIIVILLNDSVQLLNQNLERFRRSDLDPAPKNFDEVLDPSVTIGDNEWVIFCKKNARDLQKLQNKLAGKKLIVIDDEADYATPNAKINKGEITRINQLIGRLLSKDGVYIGVTATPARLDLNNTFQNENDRWVDFKPHPEYTGQAVFFPTSLSSALQFRLQTLSQTGDQPAHLREALFGFLVSTAYLNKFVNSSDINYSMLIHTSGKKADHTGDYKALTAALQVLKDPATAKGGKYFEKVHDIAKARYPGNEKAIVEYIAANISRNSIVIMNSDTDKNQVSYAAATDPATLFTFIIGGNVVSRGVTFDRLLSMFFTRDVKHRLQQDTYIQRARMFGSRGTYLKHFELTIPDQLYLDWHRCFLFHRLSIDALRSGAAFPAWMESNRVAATASSSIDRSTVMMDSGEMSFGLFDYSPKINELIQLKESATNRLEQLAKLVGPSGLPPFLIDYIKSFSPTDDSLAIHESRDMSGYSDANRDEISRKKGFIGKSDLEEATFPNAAHHIKVLHNGKGKARVFYKYVGSIRFLRNLRKADAPK